MNLNKYNYSYVFNVIIKQHESYFNTKTKQLYKVVGTKADFDNNAHDDSFYNALSWIGLKDTVAWDNLSQTQRDTIDLIIQNAIQNEDYNCTD